MNKLFFSTIFISLISNITINLYYFEYIIICFALFLLISFIFFIISKNSFKKKTEKKEDFIYIKRFKQMNYETNNNIVNMFEDIKDNCVINQLNPNNINKQNNKVNYNEQNDIYENVRSKYILKQIFDYLSKNKFFEIIK